MDDTKMCEPLAFAEVADDDAESGSRLRRWDSERLGSCMGEAAEAISDSVVDAAGWRGSIGSDSRVARCFQLSAGQLW